MSEWIGVEVDERIFQGIWRRREELGSPSQTEVRAVLKVECHHIIMHTEFYCALTSLLFFR